MPLKTHTFTKTKHVLFRTLIGRRHQQKHRIYDISVVSVVFFVFFLLKVVHWVMKNLKAYIPCTMEDELTYFLCDI